MSDSQRLLELIKSFVIEHGGDLGGRASLIDGGLQLFDGRVTSTRVVVTSIGRKGVMQCLS